MAKWNPITKISKNGLAVTIRSALPSDAPALTAYLHKMFQISKFVVTEGDEFHNDVTKEEAWIGELEAAKGSLLLLALIDGQIVGNIDFNSNATRKRILHRGEFGMSVSESYGGQGIGGLLLGELIEWARSADSPIEKIELGVFIGNHSALRLYRSKGFQEEGIVRNSAKIGAQEYLDEIRMGLFVKDRV